MMIRWILFISIVYNKINCELHLCNYIVNKSDNSLGICLSNQCNQFVDPYSIMVQPNNCKTQFLHLSFSSYKNFNLFVDRIQWKLGDLFLSKLINEERELRIYIYEIENDDQPFDHDQLIRLGINIDLFTLYIQNIENTNHLYGLIHYDTNYPQWFIIKMKFSLMIFNRYQCSSQILSPSVFALQRPSTINTFHLSSFVSSTTNTNEQNKRSIHLSIIILVPLLSILLLIILFKVLYTYINVNHSFKRDTKTKPRCSSTTSISNNVNSIDGLYSECRPNAAPYQISRLPSPHKDSLYKEPQRY